MFHITTLNGDIHVLEHLEDVREALQIDRYHLYTLVRVDEEKDDEKDDEKDEDGGNQNYLIVVHPLTDFLDHVVEDYRYAVRIDNFMSDFDYLSFNPDDCMNELETQQTQTFCNIRNRFRDNSLHRLQQSYAHLIPAPSTQVVPNSLDLPTFKEIWKRLEDAVWNYLLNLSDLTSTNLMNALIELYVYFRRR